MSPKVTIVTPSYNQAEFLEDTILSVLNQDYPNIEYIIIDGGSTDGSVDIIKKYQDKLAYWVSEPDNGQGSAINKGFSHATGQIFNWINSDDILMPSAIKIAVHYLNRNPGIGLVYGYRITIDERGDFLSLTEVPSYNKRALKYHLRIPQETIFFRKKHWHEVEGLNEDLNYWVDYDLFMKLRKVAKFYRIPFVLGAYRKHEQSKTVFFKQTGKEEAKAIYQHHFGKERNRFMKKFYKKYNRFRLWVEKKTNSYKREVNFILKIINQE